MWLVQLQVYAFASTCATTVQNHGTFPAAESLLGFLVSGPITSEAELREAVGLLTCSPGMATARETLSGYADAANAELALLPESSARDALSSLVRFVIARTR